MTDADLGIVANFGSSSLQDERLPNFVRDRRVDFVWQPQPPAEDWLYPDLVEQLLRACHRVHFVLGTGFLHQFYRRAAMVELRRNELHYQYVKHLPVEYDGQLLGEQEARLILVEGKILLAVYALRDADNSLVEQLRARLRRLNLRLGLLTNFHDTRLSVTPVRLK